MAVKTINAQMFKDMVIASANALEHNKQTINDLNVFPVPDGDTGTNMFMTVASAVREVSAVESEKVGPFAKAMGTGALKGARGNSGVITSQLFRGYSKAISPDTVEITTQDFIKAIDLGVKSAYKAVMKPKEGTILTVARAMAEEANKYIEEDIDFETLIDNVINAAEVMLQKTPDMLPVLKEAGVVDSGGAGLITIYNGFRRAIKGEQIIDELDLAKPAKKEENIPAAAREDISTADIKFQYCTEFFITDMKKPVDEKLLDQVREKLLKIGDSLVVVGDTQLIKIHVHTNDPDKALRVALDLGQLTRVKIENMRDQHSSIVEPEEPAKEPELGPKKDIGIVVVSSGEGLDAIFKDYNADQIVSGGQSMNPSTDDIYKAVEKVNADNIIILPNNKNIIMSAEQVNDLTEKNIYVVPTRSFPQGLSALLTFSDTVSVDENIENMKEAISTVKSGSLTTAIRDSKIGDIEVSEGEYIGINEGDIVSHSFDMNEAVMDLLDKMTDTDVDSIISLYYGENVTKEKAEEIGSLIEEKYEDFDIEILPGGQPVYDFILSVE
ncbi:MAG: DAK2 domain-containing protein [Clostridia bacterium]|nr:DAK2 domain-containing protein [Clostridia bacterium]